jgi:hypothetical protein
MESGHSELTYSVMPRGHPAGEQLSAHTTPPAVAHEASPKRMREGDNILTLLGVYRLVDSARRVDVLINAEQVCRIILSLRCDLPLEVPAAAGFDAGLALVVRNEVHITAAEVVRVHALSVGLGRGGGRARLTSSSHP